MGFLPGHPPGCWSSQEITHWEESGKNPLWKLSVLLGHPSRTWKLFNTASNIWGRCIFRPYTQEYYRTSSFSSDPTLSLFQICIFHCDGCKKAPNPLQFLTKRWNLFPHPLNLDWSCDLLWSTECRSAMWLLSLTASALTLLESFHHQVEKTKMKNLWRRRESPRRAICLRHQTCEWGHLGWSSPRQSPGQKGQPTILAKPCLLSNHRNWKNE